MQGSVRLAGKQLPLPRGEWIVAGQGVQPQPPGATGPFGVIRSLVLMQRSGDRVTAIAEFNTNEVALSDGWSDPPPCDASAADLHLERYRSRLDSACVFVTRSHITGGPPAWQQALDTIARQHLQLDETMLTAAFIVSDRQDLVDARLHFAPAGFPEPDAAPHVLLDWAARFAPAFEQGMANQLPDAPLDGPLRAALLSDTPALDSRLLELERLQRDGAIPAAAAAAQQQAAQAERPRSAEAEAMPVNGWYYRLSTPVINLVTAYGVTQSAPLAVAIALTEHVAHSFVYAATQANWDQATAEATRHGSSWPALGHIGDAGKPAGAGPIS